MSQREIDGNELDALSGLNGSLKDQSSHAGGGGTAPQTQDGRNAANGADGSSFAKKRSGSVDELSGLGGTMVTQFEAQTRNIGGGAKTNKDAQSGGLKKRRIVTHVKHKTIGYNVFKDGDNYWPYADSYVPKLKMVQDELIPLKDRVHKQTAIGVMNYGQMRDRKGHI